MSVDKLNSDKGIRTMFSMLFDYGIIIMSHRNINAHIELPYCFQSERS